MGLELHSFGENKANIDWRRVSFFDEESFEMHLSPNMSVVFYNLHNHKEDSHFSLWEIVGKSAGFASADLKRRVSSFNHYKDERVRRIFRKDIEYLFFDREEVDRLVDFIENTSIYADVKVFLDGAEVNILKTDKETFATFIGGLSEIGVSYTMSAYEYEQFYSTKRVKKIVSKSEYMQGGKVMSKGKLIFNLVAGSIIVTASVIAGSFGLQISSKALSALVGDTAEVILVENDK